LVRIDLFKFFSRIGEIIKKYVFFRRGIGAINIIFKGRMMLLGLTNSNIRALFFPKKEDKNKAAAVCLHFVSLKCQQELSMP